jgi:hypothetical protein
MEKKSIPKQAFLDPWREVSFTRVNFPHWLIVSFDIFPFPFQNQVLYRSAVGPSAAGVPLRTATGEKPKIVEQNRRADIPAALGWLLHDDAPHSAMSDLARARRVQMGDRPAGGANPMLGTLALNGYQGKAARISSKFYSTLTNGFSEEEKRQFLITGERRRRFAETKHAVTDTLGLGKPLPLSNFKGGFVPTGPKYRTAPPNLYPKLAFETDQQKPAEKTTDVERGDFFPWGPDAPWADPKSELGPESSLSRKSTADNGQGEGPLDFDPWTTTRWGKTPNASV